jgi:hypothetical protein
MVLHFFNKLEPFYLIMGLGIGIFVVYILKPAPMMINKYPNIENAGKVIYRDRNGACFKYETKEVKCDEVEDKLKPYSFQ